MKTFLFYKLYDNFYYTFYTVSISEEKKYWQTQYVMSKWFIPSVRDSSICG